MLPDFETLTRREWLEARRSFVGASEVATLFDLSPWMTRFELWHRKAGLIPIQEKQAKLTTWGQRLEAVIAEAVCEEVGIEVVKPEPFTLHPRIAGMGASLDYLIVNNPQGEGTLEIKNTNDVKFRHAWRDGYGPIYYELQLQHQMACKELDWGMFGVFVGGNTLHTFIRYRHQPTIDLLEQAVKEFWQSLRENIPPPPYDPNDFETVKAIYPTTLPDKHTEHTDAELIVTAQMLDRLQRQAKSLDRHISKLKARLLYAAQDAASARFGGLQLVTKTVKKKAFVVNESEYRQVSLKEVKE